MLNYRSIANANNIMINKLGFKAYFDALDAKNKKELADKASTSVNYLFQISNGHRQAGADLISRLIAADDQITFGMMRNEK